MSNLFYVEDLIEFIAGYRDHNNLSKTFWERTPSPINLARYDVNIVDSLATQTSDQHQAYTEKQAELAKKLVTKYTKQLKKLTIPILVPDNLQLKLGIRKVDQSKRIWIDEHGINVKFPYQTGLIDEVRKMARDGIGSAEFDRNNKVWKLGFTEYMINYAVALGKSNEFEIDPAVQALFDKVIEVENADFDICLDVEGGRFVIRNGASDLIEYVEEHLGGFELTNILRLCDMSPVLGLKLSDQVRELFLKKFNESWVKYIFHRKIFVDKTDTVLDEILQYASLSNRLPIFMYDSGTPKKDTDQIVYLNNKRSISQFKSISNIKLMVSTTPVLIGARKQSWLSGSEKVIILK